MTSREIGHEGLSPPHETTYNLNKNGTNKMSFLRNIHPDTSYTINMVFIKYIQGLLVFKIL